jgi:dTDP-4-dehydrorhamnose reductase
MKIVILGAAGQLGRQLRRALPGEVVGLTRADADLTKPAALRSTLTQLCPDVVVNAAGYTQVDRAEAEPSEAFAVNALAVRELAAICRDGDCTLIHFSTDYVFGLDALRTTPYSESDAADPINVYGNSKLAGEHFVRATCPKHFILRTSGLYGPSPTNFVAAMLRKAEAGEPLRVVDDQVCTPTSAFDLAQATCELLRSQAYGLYHVTNAGSCSWYEFAQAIFEAAKIDVPLVSIKTEEYAAPARRPRYSVLSNARWADAGFTPLRSWQNALKHYLAAREQESSFQS